MHMFAHAGVYVDPNDALMGGSISFATPASSRRVSRLNFLRHLIPSLAITRNWSLYFPPTPRSNSGVSTLHQNFLRRNRKSSGQLFSVYNLLQHSSTNDFITRYVKPILRWSSKTCVTVLCSLSGRKDHELSDELGLLWVINIESNQPNVIQDVIWISSIWGNYLIYFRLLLVYVRIANERNLPPAGVSHDGYKCNQMLYIDTSAQYM